MISKKLLSSITNISISNIVKIREGNSLIEVTKANGAWIEYNNHELAHKCKEWALTKHNTYLSSWTESSLGVCEASTTNEDKEFFAETEPEAIFKACDYILNELSNK